MIVKINVMKRYETLIVVCRGHFLCLFIGFSKGFVPWMFRELEYLLFSHYLILLIL